LKSFSGRLFHRSKFFEQHKIFREQVQKSETLKQEWIHEGEKVFETIQAKSAEREARGMTKAMIEQSWKAFYECSSVQKLDREVWKKPLFAELRENGIIQGNEADYYIVKMRTKTPDNKQRYEGDLIPHMSWINPKEGIMIHRLEDREEDQAWRDEHFPKGEFPTEKYPKERNLEEIKQDLRLKKLPKKFSEALYASDLAAFAYELAVKKYKEQLQGSGSTSDMNFPLKEAVGINIAYPGSVEILVGYGKPGEMQIFNRGEEGFNLVLATNYGRRVPFMQHHYPEIVGSREIDRVGIYRATTGELYIKTFTKDEIDD
jgi:hypothetical protein